MFKLILLFTFSIFLLASDLKIDMSECNKIENSVKRIECYDNATIKHNVAVENKTIQSSGENRWNVSENRDPITDATVVTFINYATSGKGRLGDSIPLIVKCSSNSKPELYINWSSYLGNEVYVTSRFGKEKSKHVEWAMSTNNQASFYPNIEYDGMPILNKLIENNEFVARVIPYNESQITAIFDLSGFMNASNPYRSICKITSLKEQEKVKKEKELKKTTALKEQEKVEMKEKLKKTTALEEQKKIEMERKKVKLEREESGTASLKTEEAQMKILAMQERCKVKNLYYVQVNSAYGCAHYFDNTSSNANKCISLMDDKDNVQCSKEYFLEQRDMQ
ncbi:MAG: type VI secretion system-associated protein TagO [Sulfurimonas sp.]|nr:type VI secretion system-associated protein TagO [Sulfurimonas sp.]